MTSPLDTNAQQQKPQHTATAIRVTFLAEAEQPEDWDEEEDGEWEPPRVPNPACETAPGCGEWKRPTKLNPAYKGPYYPPMIDNPEYKVSSM